MGSDMMDQIDQATFPEPEVLCCDALAELFLGETTRPGAEPDGSDMAAVYTEPSSHEPPEVSTVPAVATGGAPDAEPGCAVEAVLAGHLPVMASAWVSQYARGMAAKAGPVGLIRAGQSHLSIEVFGDGAPRPERAPASALEAIRRLRPGVTRWLIQADTAVAGAIIDRGEVDRLTLLCSADEAALVAGYRMVKDLLEPRLELAGGGAPTSALHIAIAGRADPEAMAAAERLSRAAERFLGIETTVAVGAARIESGASASWFEGEGADPELLEELMAELALEPARTIGGDDAAAMQEPQPHNNGAAWPAIFGPAFETSFEPAAIAADVLPEASPAAPAEPIPAAAEAPANGLSLQCPRAPAIEFRLEAGRLVAIADAREGGMDAALRHLMIAAAWAAEHEALIAMATGHSGHLAERVLLVEDAAAARRLLDADLRIRVAAAGRDEIPLN